MVSFSVTQRLNKELTGLNLLKTTTINASFQSVTCNTQLKYKEKCSKMSPVTVIIYEIMRLF